MWSEWCQTIGQMGFFGLCKIMEESKSKSSEKSSSKLLGATTTELVEIVRPNWIVPKENLDEVFPGIFIGDE